MKSAEDPRSVEEALDRYWQDGSLPGHIPNYSGFYDWVTRRLESIKSAAPLPLHLGASSRQLLPLELVRAIMAAGIEITSDGARPDANRFAKWDGKQSKLKRLNKSKLLLSYLSHSPPRWREVLLALSKADLSVESLSRTSSQSEHRAAFFHAVAKGDELAAFKMVGRLREESHDKGEVAFLEQTASFHSNRFEEAIRYAREVPNDAIDWPRSFMLLLESHAYLGDFGSIETKLRAHSNFLFPDYFLPYVCQLAIEHSSAPKDTLHQTQRIIEDTFGVSQSGPNAFQMWNRHSCQLAVRLIERIRDASLIEEALLQTAGEGEPLGELESSLSFQQLQYGLVLDGDLLSRLSQVSGEDSAYQEIVKRLMNYGTPDREDYFQALAAQWRIGDRSIFLDNVLSALDSLITDPSPEARQALAWAYQEAMILNRVSDTELLRLRLSGVPVMADKLAKLESAHTTTLLERNLSPMARVALRSANWDLEQAITEALQWKDAGMISLGFFRIVELEFNARLVLPTLQKLDIEMLETCLSTLKGSDLSRAAKDAIQFWDRMLPQLRRAKKDGRGLELGALELLFAKVASPAGADAKLKMPIHEEILRLLNSAGAEAFRSRSLAHLIDGTAREKFRNPPAHSRYIGLPIARECKQYVEYVLSRLIDFTAGDSEGPPTMH